MGGMVSDLRNPRADPVRGRPVPHGPCDLAVRNRHLAEALLWQRARSANLMNVVAALAGTALYLSEDMELRYLSDAAGAMFGVEPSDPGKVADRGSRFLAQGALHAEIAEVGRTGRPREREIRTPDGKVSLCRVLPVLTRDGRPDGVVIVVAAAGGLAQRTTIPTEPSCRGGLTPRQRQIMDRVLAGEASKTIAADLKISPRTVENHRAAIMRRTGATSLPALARMAVGAAIGTDRKVVLTRGPAPKGRR